MRAAWPIPLLRKMRRRTPAVAGSSVGGVPPARRLGVEALEARLLLASGVGNSTLHGLDRLEPVAQEIDAFPTLSLAQSGRQTRVVGGLQGAPGATFTLEFFAVGGAGPSGPVQADRLLGRFELTTDATGNAPFNALLSSSTTVGEFVRAAATGLAFTDTAKFSELVLAVVGAVAVFDAGSGELGIFGADRGDAIELSVSAGGALVVTDAGSAVPTAGGIADVQNTSGVRAALGDDDDSFTLLGDNRLQGIDIAVSGEAGNDAVTVLMPPEPCVLAESAACGALVFDGGAGDGDSLQVFTNDRAEDVAITLDGGADSQPRFVVAVADRATRTPTGTITGLAVESLFVSTGGGGDFVTAELAGDAVLTAAGAVVRIEGGAGNDTLHAIADGFVNGRVELFGGQGDDVLMLLAPDAGTPAYLATDGGAGDDLCTVTSNVHVAGCEHVDVVDLLRAAAPGDRGALLVAALDPAQLRPIVDEAIALWGGAGRSGLAAVNVAVADLPGTVLGLASARGTVWIDRDAAGSGWFAGGAASGVPAGRFDLLSAVSHELGHVLGLEHGDGLGATLQPGVRSLPQRRSVVERLGQSPIDFSDAFGRVPLLLGEGAAAAHVAGSDVGLLLDELAPALAAGTASKHKIRIPQPGKTPVRTDVLDDAFSELGALRLADERMLDETLLAQLAEVP